MSEDIYRGESSTIVLRCRDAKGAAVPMTGKRVEVVVADRLGVPVHYFSTEEKEGCKNISVSENYLFCQLTPGEMSALQGLYLVEIRVGDGGMVQIAQVPGVRILDSITGKITGK